jgi:hypothetical protein
MRWLLAVLVILAACSGTPAPTPPRAEDPALARFDLFGSTQITREQVIGKVGAPIAKLVAAVDRGDDTKALRAEITTAVEQMGSFAFVDLSAITYFGTGSAGGTFITLDLVDEADRAARMTFAAEPTGQVPDPDGLLALWAEYEDEMWAVLQAKGGATDADCPAWHCLTFDDPTLAPYLEAFETRVPAQEEALARVLRDDADEQDRARAAFLLAHVDDGPRVVGYEIASFRDPSALVRNNAMRVIALMAINHPEVDIPLAPVLHTLRFPTTTDRNKALAILSGLSKKPVVAAAIIADAGPLLLELLRLTQPNNHDFAYQILKDASGEAYPERDYASWQAWLDTRAY